MRWMADALRGAWTALAAHPGMFASVTLAVAGLNVVAPVALLSAVRKPFDFYTFNPWLKRLPEYFASDNAPLVENWRSFRTLRCSGFRPAAPTAAPSGVSLWT